MKKYYCDWCKKEIISKSELNGKTVVHKIKFRFFHDHPEDEWWKANSEICEECREKLDSFICGLAYKKEANND